MSLNVNEIGKAIRINVGKDISAATPTAIRWAGSQDSERQNLFAGLPLPVAYEGWRIPEKSAERRHGKPGRRCWFFRCCLSR